MVTRSLWEFDMGRNCATQYLTENGLVSSPKDLQQIDDEFVPDKQDAEPEPKAVLNEEDES